MSDILSNYAAERKHEPDWAGLNHTVANRPSHADVC
jgi:hypothetical protein